MAGMSVRIVGTGQLLALSRQLRSVDRRDIHRSMERRLRYAGERAAADMRNDVQGMRIWGTGSSRSRARSGPNARPFRQEIAGAIRVSVRTGSYAGARIWFDKSRMSEDRKNLGARTNDGRWRHPVYGNRRKWTTQFSQPWWEPALRRSRAQMERAGQEVLSDIRRQLGG